MQRAWEQAVGKRIVQQVRGDLQEVRVARVLGSVALQGAEVIRVAEFRAPLLEDSPVALLALGPKRLREMSFQVVYDPVAVEQGVIDIEQEYDRGKLRHPDTSSGSGSS